MGGYLGFTKFDKIEDEARQHVTAAKQHAEKAQILVEKIEAKYGEVVSHAAELEKLTAKTVGNNPDEADRAAENVQKDPAASLIDRVIATAVQLQLQGEIEKAVEKWRAIIHIAEGSDNDLAARAYFSVGYLLIQQGKLEDAIDAYDEALSLKWDFAEAYYNRGNVKSDLGRHEAAIGDFDQAIQLKSNFAEAYFNRGNSKGKLDRYEAAIDDFDKAIRLEPNDAEAYFNRGNSKGKLDRIEEARRDFEKARDLARKAGNDSLTASAEQKLRDLDNQEGE